MIIRRFIMNCKKLLCLLLLIFTLALITSCEDEPKPFTVEFDTDGGNYIPTQSVMPGEKVTAPEEPTKIGNYFYAWYYGEEKWDFDINTVNENIVLKASWIPYHTVTFDSDGGSLVPSQTVVNKIPCPAPEDPEKEGFIFAGWFYNNESWLFDVYEVTSDITLKAAWLPANTVKFDTDGGSIIGDIKVETGTLAQRPNSPVREGYIFIDWYLGSKVFDFETQVIDKDITLTALWTLAYRVRFDPDGGSTVGCKQVVANTVTTPPTPPTKDGFKFDGWYLDGVKWDFENTPVTSNITLKAKWIDANTFKVSFDLNNGLGNIPMQYVVGGDKATKPADPSKLTYTFKGWSYNGSIWNFDTDVVTEDIVLIAQWEVDPDQGILLPEDRLSYAVYFNSAGGTYVKDIRVLKHMSIGEMDKIPEDPIRPGYTFLGWYTADGFLWNMENDVVSDDMTLYARWQENK